MKSTHWFAIDRSHFSSISYAMLIVAGAIALSMAAICAAALYQSRLDTMKHAVETSRNVALLAENDVVRNLELYSLSLQAVIDGLNDPEVMAASPHLREVALFDKAATASYLGSILVLDTEGNIAIDARKVNPGNVNFSGHDFFTVHRENSANGLYVGDPYASPLHGGALSIPLSRRISHADGSFAGIVLIDVQLEYFRKLFSGLSLGANGSLALIRKDGAMMMRQPFDAKVIGRNIRNASTFKRFIAEPEGSFSDISYLDGTHRLYYFKNLPSLPFIIMVAKAHSDIFTAWRQRALIIASLMGVLTAAFIGLSFAFVTQLKRRIRAESELALLARTDGLTGLNNRRRLDEMLDQEWHRARRNHSIFSLLFVDIDRFKVYNDTYGHQAGDDVISTIAKCIGDNIRRPGDIAARYGGEEFIVVLPDTSLEGASCLAESIRAAVSQLSVEHCGSEFGYITVSIGCAAWEPEHDADVASVIRSADEALYKAKTTGRNKVVVFTKSPTQQVADFRDTTQSHSQSLI
ncbi:sensor domain-containing diguanylate cyclase [Comamonas testosteroni]|uniref:sensor domain-containing diguanylate cyclase n=2 Tax=Comamonas testosteroni TaxID=285 RepID=UPI0007614166|nr:sensor domain-containing diguanylate cyclase [Comamonas testosteroni]KWT73175.1 GGDEF domain [Comamonas testosteroni]